MKIIKITVISLLTVLGTVGCMNHKNDKPIDFTVYETRVGTHPQVVTMDKDGNITYYKVRPNEE